MPRVLPVAAALAIFAAFVPCCAPAARQTSELDRSAAVKLDSVVKVRATQLVAKTTEGPRAVVEVELVRDLTEAEDLWLEAVGARIGVDLGARKAGSRARTAVPLPEPGAEGVLDVRYEFGTRQGHDIVKYPRPDDGWVVHWIPGFHFDPVWWNTQANYVERGERVDSHMGSGFTLMAEYLRKLREDPKYTAALHQLPYVKTFIEEHPEREAELRQYIDAGRIDLVGGTYNEYSSTLVSAEAGARNAINGSLFQRSVLGGAGQTFWQCDVFGHDPSFPSVMALTGHTDGAFARGPFHQWGAPRDQVNFPSEFVWMAPDGNAILTHYMTGHYGIGYEKLASGMNRVEAVGSASNAVLADLFEDLRRPALTHHVMIPMQMDFIRPLENMSKVLTAWNDVYASPRMELSTPRRFFDGVRAEIAARGLVPRVITRDMNPIYTGCQVSFADLKLANRECESVLRDAELWATFAALEGAPYPTLGLDRAWRQLLFNAHHDGVTGSCGDQVYLDLMAGYRDAHRIAEWIRRGALEFLTSRLGAAPSQTVAWNALGHTREVEVPGLRGAAVKIPGVGARLLDDAPSSRPVTREGTVLENELLKVTLDLGRGGCVSSILDKRTGREVLTGLANDVVVVDEHPILPGHGEGPWHLSPNGKTRSGANVAARVIADGRFNDAAQSLTIEAPYEEFVKRQIVKLRPGSDQVDFETQIVNWTGRRQLLRVVFPVDTPGARPIFQTASAVIGRPFARDVDTGKDPWTLDNAAYEWAGLGSVCEAEVVKEGKVVHRIALGVGEIVVARGAGREVWAVANDVAKAFVQCGVTTTITSEDERRYGDLTLDSNTPDFLFRLTAGSGGSGWSLEDDGVNPPVFEVGVEAWTRTKETLTRSARIQVDASAARVNSPSIYARHGAALVNGGSVSVHATPGQLGLNLLRANLTWPSGAWIDGEPRRHPDGSPFGAQHGTHVFHYAFVPWTGNYRSANLTERGLELNGVTVFTQARPNAPAIEGPASREKSFLVVKPEDIDVRAVKLAGNPEAKWMWRDPRATPEHIVVRLWNPRTARRDVTLTLAYDVSEAHACDLLENPQTRLMVDGRTVKLGMGPFDTATVRIGVKSKDRDSAARSFDPTDGDVSASQYWRENAGEGVTGNGAVSMQVQPPVLDGNKATLRITNHWRNKDVVARLSDVEPTGNVLLPWEPLGVQVASAETKTMELDIPESYREFEDREVRFVITDDTNHRVWANARLHSSSSRGAQRLTWFSTMALDNALSFEATSERFNGLRMYSNVDLISGGPMWSSGRVAKSEIHGALEAWLPKGRLVPGAMSWVLLRMACSGFVSYGSSTPVNDPRGTGPRTIAFDVDQLRLKRGVKNKLVVSIQAFDPETPTREATVDATGTVEMPQLTWTNPAADWSVRATSWKETRIPARGVRAIDMEFDVTVGAAPDRGELVVKAPDGARGAVGFTVVPEQSARPEAASVKIDGDLSDWSEGEFTLAKGPLGEAQTAVRWSPEGLAFAVDALDDQHFQQESTAILWRGDSIQFAISAKPNTTLGYQGKDLEFGASLTPAGPLVWCWYGGDGGKTGRVDSARVAVKREAGHTLYEVFLPSSVLRGLDLRAGNVLGFGYIVNDNDGAGYRGATEWTPGMTGTKDSSLFGDLHLR